MSNGRPERKSYYTSVGDFPHLLASEIEEINARLEDLHVRFVSLGLNYISYLAFLRRGGHEPRSYSTDREVVKESIEEGKILMLPDQIPQKLLELFDYFSVPTDGNCAIGVKVVGKLLGYGTFFTEDHARPNWEMGASIFPDVSTVEISLTGLDKKRGLKFNVGYEQYAHKSTINYLPPQLGYIHEIDVITDDESIFSIKDGHVKTLLNSPQYAVVRWKLFESLYLFLDEQLKQERVSS